MDELEYWKYQAKKEIEESRMKELELFFMKGYFYGLQRPIIETGELREIFKQEMLNVDILCFRFPTPPKHKIIINK